MSRNYETVFIILDHHEKIPILVDNGIITPEDVEIAIEYIKEQKLLPEEELIDRVSDIQICLSAFNEINKMFQAGVSAVEIKKAIDDATLIKDEIK